jgi:hypothetical protein
MCSFLVLFINNFEEQGITFMVETSKDFLIEIIDTLNKRNFVYQRVTNGIAKKIDFVFEAIIEHLNQNAHEMEWESIEVSDDLLVVVAKIPGETAKQQNVLSVGVPLEVIKTQSKEKVLEFFVQAEALRVTREKELMELIKNYTEDISMVYDSFDDVDNLEEDGDNDMEIEKKSVPKRTLH